VGRKEIIVYQRSCVEACQLELERPWVQTRGRGDGENRGGGGGVGLYVMGDDCERIGD